MRLVYVVVVVVGVCLRFSEAWLWSNTATATATQETDTQCLAHGAAGRCEFYSCFETRLPCGTRWYMSNYGGHYCRRFNSHYDAFNQQGKHWIGNTTKCMTERLLAYYNQESVQCHDLAHFAWDTWSSCYQRTGFCDIFWENRGAFWDVYQFNDLLGIGAGKIWREMTTIILQCMAQRGSQEFEARGGLEGMIGGVRDLSQRIRETIDKK